MASGSKQAKSTGYTPPIKTASGSVSAPVKSTAKKKASPVLTNAPTKAESKSSTGAASGSELLAVQILMSDFKALKAEAPNSWQASSNGKIYWCASLDGHSLVVEKGTLLVDGLPASELLEKLLDK